MSGEQYVREGHPTADDREKVYALRRELSWTYLRKLMYLDDEVKR